MVIPDAEMAAVTLLREKLDVPVFIAPPKEVPGTYVRVVRLGGNMRNIVTDSALIGVNCYSRERNIAARLANDVRAILRDSQGTVSNDAGIRFWREVSGPVNYAHPDNPRVRYQFTGELRLATNRTTF